MAKTNKKYQSTSGRYWLVKSEPDTFSIDDLAVAPKRTTHWDGVRNYQARNTLRDQMQLGDYVLFYHSSCDEPAVMGVVQVVRAGYPDFTAFDRHDPHFDPKSRTEQPTWYMVDVQLRERFARPVSLRQLRQVKQLAGMVLLQKGSRLSVQPVRPAEFATIVELARSFT
ncbi:MAG: EVE domain-containing protein [Pirellulaceae bacterium]|nr:EVE domain-containing protein [Pirellulaceae bacterium]